VRTVTTTDGLLPAEDVAWLGRHIARTKIGLALGAGGAKGYAHIGALRVFEQAGYTVDCVSGSSIGAIVGAWIALGLDADAIEQAMRHTFRDDVVADIFKLSFAGTSGGLETMTTVLREVTQERTFADLVLPLVVMAVDLAERRPAPLREGLLWEALLAATALVGLFPPFERGDQRLVDGLALVPVPTDAVRGAGADIAVSVNLISRSVLAAWPGQAPPPVEEKNPRVRMLDTLLEVMDLAQLDSSERHAARADVPITPRFGPCTWRDFQLADLFLEAGREAAEQALPALGELARPQLSHSPT
jgi:NTE family protein